MSGFELVRVQSGVWSLRSTENREVFHPGIGPIQEATDLHVRQQQIRERLRNGFVIWDVGLGAAGNAIAAIDTILESPGRGTVQLHSFDLSNAAVSFALEHAAALEYPVRHQAVLREVLENGTAEIGDSWRVVWWIHLGDFTELVRKPRLPEAPDAVFYDPYSPKHNPKMWTLGHLRRLRRKLTKSCTATSYTRSTAMRVTFLCAGFYVGRGTGIGEKDETTIISTNPELLETPLPAEWLERVRRSSNAAPWTDLADSSRNLPICAEWFERLATHPQFSMNPDGSFEEIPG